MVVFHLRPEWTILATLGPTLSALLTRRFAAGDVRAFRVVGPWRPTLVIAVLGAVAVIVAYAVLPAVATADPRRLHRGIFASASVYHFSLLLGGPLFEEPGWRGFALPRLEARFGPLRATVLLALLWADWHTPMFWYPGWITSPLWIYLLFLVGDSVLLTYASNRAGFVVVVPIAMHAAFNTSSRYLNGLFSGTDGPHTPLRFELVMALGGLAAATVIVVATRGTLGYRRDRLPASAFERDFRLT